MRERLSSPVDLSEAVSTSPLNTFPCAIATFMAKTLNVLVPFLDEYMWLVRVHGSIGVYDGHLLTGSGFIVLFGTGDEGLVTCPLRKKR